MDDDSGPSGIPDGAIGMFWAQEPLCHIELFWTMVSFSYLLYIYKLYIMHHVCTEFC
jgi:hypothetical protein